MERVNPADAKQQRAGLLSSVSVKELREGIAKANARAAVQGIRSLIRSTVEAVHPLDSEQKRRAFATASLTEWSGRHSSVFNGPKHVYAGTVSHQTKQRRRKQNQMARVSRRHNRSGR